MLRYVCGLLLFVNFSVQAQRVEISLNRNQILIGEHIHLGLKVQLPAGSKAYFKIPDTIPHFDFIQKNEVQAVRNENAIEQVIIFTSFDSGKWFVPSLPVIVSSAAGNKTIYSDSISINVGYAPDDGTGNLRDIKPIRDVEIADYFWYYFLAGLILLILLIILAVKYFASRKKRTPVVNTKGAFDEALSSLDVLERSYSIDRNAIRDYHSQLTEIFRKYYSKRTGRNVFNSTTSEILILLDGNVINISEAASVLRLNDAVKFAKFLPSEQDSRSAVESTRKLIIAIEKSIAQNS